MFYDLSVELSPAVVFLLVCSPQSHLALFSSAWKTPFTPTLPPQEMRYPQRQILEAPLLYLSGFIAGGAGT